MLAVTQFYYRMDRPSSFNLGSDKIDFNLNDEVIDFSLNAETEDDQPRRLLEEGSFRLLEDGSFRLLE